MALVWTWFQNRLKWPSSKVIEHNNYRWSKKTPVSVKPGAHKNIVSIETLWCWALAASTEDSGTPFESPMCFLCTMAKL
jgi:hypothetical protein